MAAETQTPCPECGYRPDMVRNALRAGTRCKTCGRFCEGAPPAFDRNGQWLTKTPEEWIEFLRMFDPKDLTPARCVNLQDHLRSITSLEDEVIRLRGEQDAAVTLCRIYFDIAAEVIGEDEVRLRRDEMIDAAIERKRA